MVRLLEVSPTYCNGRVCNVVRIEVPESLDLDAMLAAIAALSPMPDPAPAPFAASADQPHA